MAFQPVSDDYLDTYTGRMAQSLPDKLFFAEHLDADVFVDFGCADGALLRELRGIGSQAHLVGFDLDELALQRARGAVDGGTFFADWGRLEAHLEQLRRAGARRIALIASSVLHEVYAYGGDAAGETFWNRLKHGPFSDFVLRDMTIAEKEIGKTDLEAAARVRLGARRMGLARHLASFEDLWGPVEYRENLTHYLLKYRYLENWDRELRENYLPIGREAILSRITESFDTSFADHARLRFLEDRAQAEFGTGFPCATHLRLICHRG